MRCWWNGRHAGLRNRCLRAWGFESLAAHCRVGAKSKLERARLRAACGCSTAAAKRWRYSTLWFWFRALRGRRAVLKTAMRGESPWVRLLPEPFVEENKHCRQCDQSKPRSAFRKNVSKRDGLQTACLECDKAHQASWYRRNSTRLKAKCGARRAAVRLETQKRVFAYLKEHPCVDCGEPDPVVLEFDHADRVTKLDTVARMMANGSPWPRIEEEIAKCDVRCANCHKRRTALQLGWAKLGFT